MTKPRSSRPADHPTDSTAELLTRVRRGDPSAEDEIVRRQLPALRQWARGRLPQYARSAGDTEDLVQDTFLHALARLTRFQSSHPGALQAYLRVAVRNRVRDELRRVARRPPAEPLTEVDDGGVSPLDATLAEETRVLYERALSGLRPVDRALIQARIDREWDYAKIARAFGKPTADAARVAVARAFERLMREIQGLANPVAARPRGTKKPRRRAKR